MIRPVGEGTLTTSDGRTLAYVSRGADDGFPVIVSHGTPGSRYARHADPEIYERHGVRAVAYDRPGYGGSDPLSAARWPTLPPTSPRSPTSSASSASPSSAAPVARRMPWLAGRCSPTASFASARWSLPRRRMPRTSTSTKAWPS